MPATTKLTPAMAHVLRRMAQGWELRVSTSVVTRGAFLRRPGMPNEDVRQNTRHALQDRGLIALERREYPNQGYVLTDAGRQVATALPGEA